MTTGNIKAVIFDLGNVVIRFSYEKAFRAWARILSIPSDGLKNAFRIDEPYHRFERGQISPEEYGQHLASLFRVEMSQDQFLEGWNAIFDGYVPGILEILEALRKRVRMTALTNTNCLHSDYWKSAFPETLDLFEKIFESSVIGCRKPEPESFRTVLDYLGMEPEETLFLDDLKENVEAAETLGIRGIHVSSIENMKSGLNRYNLL